MTKKMNAKYKSILSFIIFWTKLKRDCKVALIWPHRGKNRMCFIEAWDTGDWEEWGEVGHGALGLS